MEWPKLVTLLCGFACSLKTLRFRFHVPLSFWLSVFASAWPCSVRYFLHGLRVGVGIVEDCEQRLATIQSLRQACAQFRG